jgi:hypothetical protein
VASALHGYDGFLRPITFPQFITPQGAVMRKILILAAASALTLAGVAHADAIGGSSTDQGATGAATGATASLTSLDKNSDGKVSKSEASSNKDLSKQFATLDSNKDGNLDQAEFAKFEMAGAGASSSSSSSTSTTTSTTPADSDSSKKKTGGY